jgi:hypothetical protein
MKHVALLCDTIFIFYAHVERGTLAAITTAVNVSFSSTKHPIEATFCLAILSTPSDIRGINATIAAVA